MKEFGHEGSWVTEPSTELPAEPPLPKPAGKVTMAGLGKVQLEPEDLDAGLQKEKGPNRR
jgi:hypothetical protein